MGLVALLLLACAVGVGGVLVWWSTPGRPQPYRDADGRPVPGSVSEKVYVDVNGLAQGMFLKGRDASRPVLLYLHGGMPDYFLAQRMGSRLEDLFTVCWWEQRGSGLSYDPALLQDGVSVEQLVSDTLEVTNYLRRRFGQERIYLMGHSGGTFLGMLAVQRAPELYVAYVGVAQMADQLESERLAWEHMLARYRELGDAGMVRRLQAAPVTREQGVPAAYLGLRDEAMHRLGVGTTRAMRSVVTGLFLPSLQSREHTLAEKVRTWRGKAATGVSSLWREMLATDLSRRVPEVRVPVYFLHGVHDYTCTFAVARAYFEKLKAPLKGFYSFEESAHSPLFEEQDRALRILREDVLAGRNGLADGS